MQREQGWYWVKWGDEWRPACYEVSLGPGLAWWIDDYTVDESRFEAIGPRIRTPDEPAPKPYGWACENRSPSGVLLGVRFVAGDIPTGRNRTEHWFPLWRYADLEMLTARPTLAIKGPTASEIAQQLRDAERLVARERTIAKQAMAYDALDLALSVAGSSIHDHLSPADALNWLVEHHKAAQTQVPDGYVRIEVCVGDKKSVKMASLISVRMSNVKQVGLLADQSWEEIESAITASQDQAVDTYGSREHECGSDT